MDDIFILVLNLQYWLACFRLFTLIESVNHSGSNFKPLEIAQQFRKNLLKLTWKLLVNVFHFCVVKGS